jgi:hypothetical protein
VKQWARQAYISLGSREGERENDERGMRLGVCSLARQLARGRGERERGYDFVCM